MANSDKKVEWVLVDGKNTDTASLKPEVAKQAQDKIEQCKQAVTSARANNDRHDEAVQLSKLGKAYFNFGQVSQSIESYEQALSIFQELGDPREEADIHTHLGVAHIPLKDAKNVHAHYVQAWQIYDKIGDQAGVAKELRNLGAFYEMIEQPQKAVDFYRHALGILRELGDRDQEASTLGDLGVLCMELGSAQQAIELHEQALAILRDIGNRKEEISILLNLGSFHLHSKQWNRALEYNIQALGLSRELGDGKKEALALKNIGLVYFGMQQVEKAIEFTEASVKVYEQGGYYGADNAHKQLAQLSKVKVQKTPRFVVIPIGLIFMLIVAIFINLANRSSNSSQRNIPPTIFRPPTGTLAGMVLDKNRRPLVNVEQGEIGIMALLCTDPAQSVECLDENAAQMDVSALISSICETSNTERTCLLHWGQSAAQIDARGSYIMRDIPPGEYDVMLIVIDSGIVMTVQIKNVDPIQGNQITYYELVTQ